MAIAPRLRELSLSGTLVSTAAALQLVCDLEKDGAGSSLCRINLAGPPRFAGHTAVKGFGDVGARSLAAWAGDAGLSPRLTSLNVALNNIGPVGAAAFGRALKDNNRLQAFCIADNTIFHTRDFEAPLRGNVSLTHLDLSRCGIYSTGVQGLARGLSGNRTLRVLLLRANSLESAGACTRPTLRGRAWVVASCSRVARVLIVLPENVSCPPPPPPPSGACKRTLTRCGHLHRCRPLSHRPHC